PDRDCHPRTYSSGCIPCRTKPWLFPSSGSTPGCLPRDVWPLSHSAIGSDSQRSDQSFFTSFIKANPSKTGLQRYSVILFYSKACVSGLPARFGQPGNLSLMGHLPEYVTADAEFPHVALGPAGQLATVLKPNGRRVAGQFVQSNVVARSLQRFPLFCVRGNHAFPLQLPRYNR